MTRLAPLTPEEMTAEQRDAYETIAAIVRRNGIHPEVPITYLTWLRSPELALQMIEFGPFIRHRILDYRKRELAILVTGRLCKAPLEWHLHLPFAREAGIEEEVIAALAERRRPSFADPADAALYDVASELVAGQAMSDATYARAIEALGARQLVELVAIVGFYTTIAMLIGTFRFALPEGTPPPFTDQA